MNKIKSEDTIDKFAVFSLNDEKYGIEISNIKEIIRWTEVTPLPKVSKEVIGIISFRNKVVPIVSLRKYFNLQELDKLDDTKIIILELGNFLIGMHVDNVEAVVDVHNSMIQKTDKKLIKSDFIEGIYQINNYLLILLDIKTLFPNNTIVPLKQLTEDYSDIKNNKNVE